MPLTRYASHIALVSFIYVPSSCLKERCDTLMEDDVGIDSKFAIYGSVVDYMNNIIGYSQIEGVDHDVVLASIFFQDEGVDLV
jgi:hypothetical protein